MNNKVILVIIAVILVGGGYLFATSQKAQAPSTATPSQTYTMQDIKQHATTDDCWMAIDGKVYDVTSYISDQQHPGGKAILEGCGRDASEIFHTSPPHSREAESLLPDYVIGTLAE